MTRSIPSFSVPHKQGMSVTSGQQILLPERDRKKVQRKTTVVVNSRDRHVISYPNTNTFRFLLRRPLKEILSIELVNGCIPGLIYNMNTGWNQFTFSEGGLNYNLTIPPGFYDPTSLAAQLQVLLNTLPFLANTYVCMVGDNDYRLTIECTEGTESFGILFYSGTFTDEVDYNGAQVLSIKCPARFLGFGYKDYYDVSGVITAPVAMDTENFLNRIYLYINAESTIDLHRMELGAGGKDCFHIFYFSPGKDNYIFLNKETETPAYISKPAPISRLSFLDISLRDEFYRPIDFQNRDVNLVFEITHLE
jgi:hypothetical protein